MANNRIQVKRTSVAGRTANVTSSGNSQYIAAGELALNMPDGILYTSNGSALITVGANVVNQNVSGNLTVNAVIANGSLGTAGQTLTTNGSNVYWSSVGSGTVTQVNTGNGMAGGPITTTGTISVVANNGLSANATGVYVVPGDGLAASNSTGVHVGAGSGVTVNSTAVAVLANTGIVANATGVYVNATYIGTLTSNNTSFVGSTSAANVVSNTQLSSNLANYQTTAGLSANVATLTANNTSFVGSVSAANVVSNAQLSSNLANYQTTAGLSANVATLTSNNSTFSYGKTEGALNVNSAIYANGSITNTFTVGTSAYFVSNGNLGIGISSPSAPLQIAYTSGVPNSSLLTTDTVVISAENTSPGFAFIVAGNTGATQRGVFKATRTRGTLENPTAPNSGDDTFTLIGAIYDGAAIRATAAVNMAVDGSVSSNVAPQRITFLTGNASSRIERMRIDSSGNVGIGNTSPDARLAVTGTANVSGNVVIGGVSTFNANVVLGSSAVSANGGVGTAGQVLHSNGSAAYWAADDQGVTSVATGNGMTGGTITATGTVSVLANTGIVANATGVFVNATYIGTISANNASFLGGTAAASYQTTAGLSSNVATLTSNNSTFSYGKTEIALNVNSALTSNNSTNLGGQAAAFYTNATNITTGTLPYARIPANIINTTAAFTRTGITTFSANVVLGSSGVSSNGGFGTAGHVLHTNGTSTYWDVDDQGVTSVASGNGLTGGPITTTGTLAVGAGNGITVNATAVAVLANNGLSANATGVYVVPGNGLAAANSTGVHVGAGSGVTVNSTAVAVLANTGIVANATGVYVNSTYIGTLTSNNTSFVGSTSAANVVSNTQLQSNLANYQTTADLSANVATLTSNNSTFSYGKTEGALNVNSATTALTANNSTNLGGIAASGYQTTAGLSSNVATLTANNTSFVGSVSAANVVSNAQLSSNLANYQTTAGLASNVSTLTSNNSTFSYGKTEGALNVNNATTAYGKVESALNVNSALTANNSTNLGGQAAAFYTNATNITTGTLPYAQIPANVINTTAAFTRTGITTFSANVVLGSSGLSANGSFGTTGQVLHSNGTATYWDIDDQGVTSVASGNGLTGGPITTTGTLAVGAGNGITVNATAVAVLANNGLSANATGVYVVPGNGLVAANSTGVHVGAGSGVTVNSTAVAVNPNTGIVANATGVFVNATYIGTISANNASFLGGVAAASYQTTAGLSANVATLTSNNATFINGNNVLTVMESLRANRALTGGGTITVDGSGNVLWSARFIVISNGRGTHFSTVGFFDINCPTSGTITGVGGASNKTAAAAGIPLGSWEALYYIMPIGSGSTSQAANFRVALYTSDLEIPSDWLLICVRNGDNGNFYFNNGIILKTGQSYVGGSHTSTTVGSNTFTVGTSAYFVNNGNVGVGNTAPTEKLHVEGKIRIGTQATATTDAVRADRGLTAGDGLTGGGNLTADRTFTLGTPSTLTGSTLNAVTATSHTHAITVDLGVTNGTTAGPVITSSAGTNATIPTASATISGAVTTGAQTWAGVKTFNSTISGSINGNANTATTLATGRTIALSGGATGTATSFNGSANITIPVTALDANTLSSGTIPDARLSGTYSGFTHKLDGVNTVFTEPSSGTTNTLGRTVYGLAEYRSNSGTQVGAIVFIAPNTNSTIMHQLEIQGLLYNQNIFRCAVQGYRTTGAWSDVRKISFGTVDVQTRWAVTPDGKNCLILGDVATSWSFPHFSIVRALFSHSGLSDAYCTGWTVAVVTDLSTYTNITSTIADSTLVGSVSGNAGTATTLATARTLWGQSFNGSANITGNLTSVGNITGTGAITITAGGTNQSITLTPSGTGVVNAPTFNATSATDGGFQGITTDSASIPSFTWTGNLNTGIFHPGTNLIGFTTNGGERVRIDATGNVGIGTSSPNARLAVAGNVTVTTNVTVGRGSADSVGLAPFVWVNARANSTSNAPTSPQEMIRLSWQEGSQDLGAGEGSAINFAASLVGDADTFYNVAQIASLKESGVDSARNSSLIFSTSNDQGVTLSERMRIDSAGNVGIGTTAPAAPLQVVGGVRFGSSPSQTTGTIALYNDGDNATIEVFAGNNSATKRNLLLATYGGNVGIGTTSPGCSLQVNGGIRARGGAPGAGGVNNNGYAFSGNSGDTDSGMFSSADGQLEFYGNNAERMRLSSAGNLGIGTTSPGQRLEVSGTGLATTDFRAPIFYDSNNTAFYTDPASTSVMNTITYTLMNGPGTNTRDKLRVWNSSLYTIGMTTAFTFGSIANDYAMTFQMNNSNARGFWWGDDAHTNAQGAMALSTEGRLTVAHSIRVGHGESDTTLPGATYRLDVSGDVGATGNITAYYSDIRLKEIVSNIDNPIEIIKSLRGFKYRNNETAKQYGYNDDKIQIGLSAQEVEAVLPEIISIAPFDAASDGDGNIVSKSGENYKTLDYAKLVPVLIEAIKEQQVTIEQLKTDINTLKGIR